MGKPVYEIFSHPQTSPANKRHQKTNKKIQRIKNPNGV